MYPTGCNVVISANREDTIQHRQTCCADARRHRAPANRKAPRPFRTFPLALPRHDIGHPPRSHAQANTQAQAAASICCERNRFAIGRMHSSGSDFDLLCDVHIMPNYDLFCSFFSPFYSFWALGCIQSSYGLFLLLFFFLFPGEDRIWSSRGFVCVVFLFTVRTDIAQL